MSKLTKLFWVLIFLNFIYVGAGVYAYPLRSIDVFADWLLKAKAFYLAGSLPLQLLTNPVYSYSHPQYPLLLPWLYSRLYILVGSVQEYFVLALYPLFYLAVVFCCWSYLRRHLVSPSVAALITYLYSMTGPLLAQGGRYHAGTADIVITLFVWLLLLLSFPLNPKLSSFRWWSIALLVFIASQLKTEGVFFSVFILLGRLPPYKKALIFSAAVSGTLAWNFIFPRLGIVADLHFIWRGFWPSFTALLVVGQGTVREMLNLNNWYLLWPAWWLLQLVAPPGFWFQKRLLLSLATLTFLYTSTYVFSQLETAAYVSSSIDRILLQLSPIFIALLPTLKET